MRTFLILILTVICWELSLAQGLTSEGREFYLGSLNASRNDVSLAFGIAQIRVYVVISSYTDNEVAISYFDPQSGVEGQASSYTIEAHRSIQVPLDHVLMRASEPGDKGEFRSCHIVAKHPVSVHYFRSGSCATGGYLALPVGTWGKQYVIASDPDNPGFGAWTSNPPPQLPPIEMSNGAFMVIAAADGTHVTISPNALTGGGHAGTTQGAGSTGTPQPYSITLNRGQCYLVKSVSATAGNTDDISGSIITADKPVAVIMGHENANVGDGLVKEQYATDARDFMIEQAVPWEYASHAGIATIPMVDSKGTLDGGYGEDVKMFVADAQGASSVSVFGCTGQPNVVPVSPYSVASRSNVMQPQGYGCDSGKRFQVLQYELRSHGDGVPYTAPAMMNIIPQRSWRNAYLWFIPAKPLGPGGLPVYEEYYVTVLGNSAIRVSLNGANISNPPLIDQALKAVVKKWTCVPGIPGITATTYKISSGITYYAQSADPFMVYVFGYASTHEAPPLGPFVVSYSGFGYPAGMRGKTDSKERIGLNVDTLCTSWKVCATDTNGAGIKSIVLLNDPNGVFLNRTDISQPKHVATNCRLELATSLDGMEIAKLIPDVNLCATIKIIDSTQDAYAPVVITDAAGNVKFMSLTYEGKQLTMTPPFAGFTNVRVGATEEKKLVIRTQNSFLLSAIEISDTSVFTMEYSRPLPVTLLPNDSLVLTIAFSPQDTMLTTATLRFSNDCIAVGQSFLAKGATGLIAAGDRDFGSITQSSSRCLDIRVENKGSVAYTLLPGFTITGSAEFSIDSAEQARLPVLVSPGGFVMVNVCYRPQDELADTAIIHWVTDINEPYNNSIKNTSTIYGKTVQQDVQIDGQEPQLSLRPNPNNGICILDLRRLEITSIPIAIFNTLGVECFSTIVAGGREFDLHVPQLPAGKYIVRVSAGEEVYDVQLLIQ